MSNAIRSFRDIVAWQKGMDLARSIYRATCKMPKEEQFGLTMQMRRAAVSIPSNIAEGYGRQGRADYVRFLKMARGSLGELSTQYELAASMELMPMDPRVESLLREDECVLQALIMSLERK